MNTFLGIWGVEDAQIQDCYPVRERLVEGFDSSTAFFVDVGAGVGQRCALLKRSVPGLPGRFVAQDLPAVIESGEGYPGVELQGYDFFEEQPVKSESVSEWYSKIADERQKTPEHITSDCACTTGAMTIA